MTKTEQLGRESQLGDDNARKIVSHILNLDLLQVDIVLEVGMTYELADRLDNKHTFKNSVREAGYNWLSLFEIVFPNCLFVKRRQIMDKYS